MCFAIIANISLKKINPKKEIIRSTIQDKMMKMIDHQNIMMSKLAIKDQSPNIMTSSKPQVSEIFCFFSKLHIQLYTPHELS